MISFPASSPNAVVTAGSVVLVVDTNVLVHSLPLVHSLEPQLAKYKFYIVIPWIVLQELDDLKRKTSAQDIQQNVRQAIEFLHRRLSDEHSLVIGQKIDESSSLSQRSNDDLILDCCLYYNQHDHWVFVLSNDKNFINKCAVHSIPTFCNWTGTAAALCAAIRAQVEEATNNDFMDIEGPSYKFHNVNTLLTNGSDLNVISADNVLFREFLDFFETELSKIIAKSMNDYLGADWQYLISSKPPWPIGEIYRLLSQNWIAVFGNILPRCCKEDIFELAQSFRRSGDVSAVNPKKLLNSAMDICKYFNIFLKKEYYEMLKK